jgi:isoquinoline 1-oxidoreductase beta subunit
MEKKSRQGGWIDRRALLGFAAAGGSVALLGRMVPASAQTILHGSTIEAQSPTRLLPFYLSIRPDNRTVFTCPATEIGQGITTSLAQIIAEELDCGWDLIDVALAGAGDAYVNPPKKQQSVGQSFSIRGYHDSLRLIGAAAREMLSAAAAERLGVPVEGIETRDSFAHHPASGRKLSYAELADAANRLPPPDKPKLRDRADYRLIGQSRKRLDTPDKVAGRTIYAVDMERPGMLCAALALAPVAGGKLTGFDRKAALASPGVRQVVETTQGYTTGIAVLADHWWQAKAGLEAGQATFSTGEATTESLRQTVLAGLEATPVPGGGHGDVPAAFAGATEIVAEYETPFLAHATMEPLSAVADVRTDGCTLWAGTQSQQRARDDIAKLLGLPLEKVVIETLPGGGGFGRRWYGDFVLLAVELSKAAGRPVKLIFHREMDMTHDVYRPSFAMRGKAAISGKALKALDFHIAGPSISEFGRPGRLQGKVDPVAVSGLKDCPYAVPFRVQWSSTPTPVPVGVWRSVGHSHNGFFLESLIDEAARAARADPVAFRKPLLAEQPRLLAVLDKAVAESGWGRKLPKGRGLGVAVSEAYGSYVAEVVEVELKGQEVRIVQIWAAIDCGTAINPKGVEAQMESAIVFGLSALFWGQVDFEDGAAQQTNFHDYRVLTLKEMPPVHTYLVDTGGALGGAGEPGLVPLSAAICNAIVAAGGKRPRRLPLAAEGWEMAA